MVWIKICGITNLEDAIMVSRLDVNAIGFVLSTDSPRRICPDGAEEISKGLSLEKISVPKVGVFVNESVRTIINYCREIGLDYIQLSGDEDISFLKRLKKEVRGLKIIKALRIRDKNKINESDKFYSPEKEKSLGDIKRYADFVLFDSYKKNAYGGTGQTFNWDAVKEFTGILPVILSGGLEPENVELAIRIVKPFGVDASSLLESRPGKKDIEKVKRFVSIVRRF
jgi:phosphoribosylanthranilate isomerase